MAEQIIPEVNVADIALGNTKQRGGKRGLVRLNPPSASGGIVRDVLLT